MSSSLIKKYENDLYLCSRQKEALKKQRKMDVMELFRLREENAKGTVFAPQIERKKQKFYRKFQSNGFMPQRSSTGGGGSFDFDESRWRFTSFDSEELLVEISQNVLDQTTIAFDQELAATMLELRRSDQVGTALLDDDDDEMTTEMERLHQIERQIKTEIDEGITDLMFALDRLGSKERQRTVSDVSADLRDRVTSQVALLKQIPRNVPIHYNKMSDEREANLTTLERAIILQKKSERLKRRLKELKEEEVLLAVEKTAIIQNDLETDRIFETEMQSWAEERHRMRQELETKLGEKAEFDRMFELEPVSKVKRNKVVNKRNLDIFINRKITGGLLIIILILIIWIMVMSERKMQMESQYSNLVKNLTEELGRSEYDVFKQTQLRSELEQCNTVIQDQLVLLDVANKTLFDATVERELVYDFDYPQEYNPYTQTLPGVAPDLISLAAMIAFWKQNLFGNR